MLKFRLKFEIIEFNIGKKDGAVSKMSQLTMTNCCCSPLAHAMADVACLRLESTMIPRAKSSCPQLTNS